MEAPIRNLTTLSRQQFRQFLKSFDTILTDCDGVIYNFYEPLPGVAQTISKLQDLQKDVKFVTNNTRKTVDFLHETLKKMDIQLNKEDIVYPTMALIAYLKSIHFKKKVFFCGLNTEKQDLLDAGFRVETGPEELDENMETVKLALKDDPEIGAVFLNMDFTLNYLKLVRASVFLKRPDVLFLASMTTENIPYLGMNLIGPGYFCKLLENFTGRRALLFGKPSSILSAFIKEKYNIGNPARVLFIGDCLHQDMSFATHSGFQKLFVLTGINSLEDAKCADADERPDYYINSLGDMRFLLDS